MWADTLVDLTPNNPLLHLRERSASTLDLTAASPDGLARLLAGRGTRLTALFEDGQARDLAARRLRSVRKRATMIAEEQGIEVGRIARGLLRLEPFDGRRAGQRPLRAPLLLQSIRIEPRTATEADFLLTVQDDPEFNPVLPVALERERGIELPPDLPERIAMAIDGTDDVDAQLEGAFAVVRDVLAAHSHLLELAPTVTVGCFAFEKLPMLEDLRSSTELLAEHDVVAAAAGDRSAMHALLDAATGYRSPDPDEIPPADEFLVLDADSSQHRAIRAVLDGQHVVIQGPPGTGKSQTIANVIAAAAAAGERVLFVTEKRAAIEAVTERLAEAGLAELVLDLHGKQVTRREVARQVAESLDRLSTALPPDVEDVHRALVASRTALVRNAAETYEVRSPWGLSAYEVEKRLLDLPATARSDQLLPRAVLQRLDRGAVDSLRRQLGDFVNLGGLTLRRGESAWSRAQVRDPRQAEELLFRLDRVTGREWHQARQAMIELIEKSGLPRPLDLAGWTTALTLMADVERAASMYWPDVHGPDLDRHCAAVGDRAWRRAHPTADGWWQRRRIRQQLQARRRGGPSAPPVMFAELRAAFEQREAWRHFTGDPAAVPRVIGTNGELQEFSRLRDEIAAIALSANLGEPSTVPVEQVEATMSRLHSEDEMLRRLPELSRLAADLESNGLGDVLDSLAERDVDAAHAQQILLHAYYSSLLRVFRHDSPELATFSAARQDATVAEFHDRDAAHLRLNAARIRRRVAERLRDARDQHREQNRTVVGEANRKRGHLPLRKLVAAAPDVLLAARPCWSMSPIVVSRLLPAERLFDIVVFDEASQVEPVDAMTSIMRGHRLVVAGDDQQLPPSTYFRRLASGASDDEDVPDNVDSTPSVTDFESVLKCLATFLPTDFRLRWHYRSSDERLIAFSNEEFYERSLLTFPGRQEESPLRLHVVDGHAAPGIGGLVEAEIDRVVELVVEHAAERPERSLGVITANVDHQERIEAAVRRAAIAHPALAEFQQRMAGPRRRLFVKSLESVQGDERDVIVLSIGRAKGADGRLRRYFGPINQEGGERRLNVAVSRARTFLHVVSAFAPDDIQPESRRSGPEMLRRFLHVAATGAEPRHVDRAEDVELNPIERDLLAELHRRRIPAVPQWGVGGYRIDFALADPDRPGRLVLAVELDGDRYHRLESVRDRDRLRQEHLERMGWTFHRVWASAWFTDRTTEADRIERCWREALTRPRPTPEPREQSDERTSEAARRGPRPPVEPGRGTIDRYGDAELDAVARWIRSDGLPLDRETRLAQMRRELGFRRRGRRIDERCGAALDRVGH
jgi:very-short-patch-repair endonuclease